MRLNKNIKYYFIADIISLLGSNLALISINWFILEKTGFNEYIGIFTMLGLVGGLITAPFGGIITDHFNRKYTIIYSNYLRAIAIFAVLVLLLSQNFHIYYAYILAVINGIGFNIYLPASRALVQEIVDQKEFTKWNAMIEISIHLSMVAAGAITGLIYHICGIHVILFIDILSFLISNLFLYKINYMDKTRDSEDPSKFIKKLRDGTIYLWSNSSFMIFLLFMLLPHVATLMLSIVLPGYVLNHLSSNSVTYGIINMCESIGAIISATAMSYLHLKAFKSYHIGMFLAISIISVITMISAPFIIVAYAAILCFGICNTAIKILLHSTIMRVTHKDYMGRIVSIKNVISTVFQMFSSYSIGTIMDKYGDISGYISLLIIMTVSFIGYLLYSSHFKAVLEDR